MSRLIRLLFILPLLSIGPGCGRGKDNSTQIPSLPPVVSQPSVAETADNRPIIAALGDSLTAGLGVATGDNYPSQLQRKLDSSGYRFRVVNAGVSGDTSGQGLGRLDSVLSMRPAIVIVELGANDGLRGLPVEQTRGNLQEVIRGIKEGGSRAILAGMQMPPNYGPDYTHKFNQIYREVAGESRIPLIPFFLAGVGGIAELNQDDGIHPTGKGYAKVTENVWEALEPALRAIAPK